MDKEHDKILFEELIKAIQNNDIKCVKNLINQGVNINREKYINKIGYRTPLMISIENKDDDMTLLLLENGAKADLPFVRLKDERETALNIAVKNGNYNIVNELIKRGAKLNVISEYETPLRKAIDEGYTDIAILLVNSGANYNIVDYGKLENGKEVECRTSFELAHKKGYKDVIYAMERKEEEEKLKRQELRDKYIEKMKNEIQSDDDLKYKFSDYVIELYTNLKMNVSMGVDFDLNKIDDEKFDELLLITNYKNKKLKQKNQLTIMWR